MERARGTGGEPGGEETTVTAGPLPRAGDTAGPAGRRRPRPAGRSRSRVAATRAAGLSGAAVRRAHAAARADGAGESGLAHLIEMHAFSSAGDALVAVALAGTLFFGVPLGEARGRVALYLLLTMAPFALLAPVIGPALDRLHRGRRLAIAATLVGRGVLALGMGRGLATSDPLTLYPAAFGVLILAKAYGVGRSAVVPRLLPASISLVKANARLSLFGLLFAAAAAPIGGGLATFGPVWTLRLAAVVYIIAAGFTISLPARIDSGELDGGDGLEGAGGQSVPGRVSGWRARLLPHIALGPVVGAALYAAASMRWLNGFLTVFLAFLTKHSGGIDGLGPNVVLGMVVGAAGVGGLLGTGLGARLPTRAPQALAVSALMIATSATVLAMLFYGVVTLVVVGAATGVTQSLTKLALDSLIQREVPYSVRSSAFARSESSLQLAWVIGGVFGIALPLIGEVGLGVATAVCAITLLATLRSVHRNRAIARAGRTEAGRGRGAGRRAGRQLS